MRLKPQTYAVTISAYQQHRHFQRTANAELFIATLFRYREVGKFLLHGFVVMPDHVHVLTHPPNPRAKRFHAQIQYFANNPILFVILSRWVPQIGYLIIPVLAVFLVMQFLRYLIPREPVKNP